MELSIIDLSKYLGVDPTTIERWLRQGKLPVSRKGKNYTFRSTELEKWASKNNINLNIADKRKALQKKESSIPLSKAVKNGGVFFDIQGDDVKTVLKASINMMSDIPGELKPDLLDRLIERENALSTGIGNAIAIPHPRVQLPYLKQPLVSICFLDHPVDYKALDNQPVSILFFILCPDLKMHLGLLSALSFCLKDSQFTGFLKSRPDLEAVVEKIEMMQSKNPQK